MLDGLDGAFSFLENRKSIEQDTLSTALPTCVGPALDDAWLEGIQRARSQLWTGLASGLETYPGARNSRARANAPFD
jgi:hypothetical protein